MRITFEDGTGRILEDLRNIVYCTYKGKSTKEKKTTYDSEKAIADQAAADAAAAQAGTPRQQ